MKKKLIILCAACALVCMCSFGVTYAYLKTETSATNSFVVGENSIKVEENYETVMTLGPGIVNKDPKVTNTGNIPCYVRMRVDFSDGNAKKFCTLQITDDKKGDWVYCSADGYYYYTKVLEPNDSTEPLFTSVCISETATSGDSEQTETGTSDSSEQTETAKLSAFNINVYAESKQAADLGKDDTYQTVWGIDNVNVDETIYGDYGNTNEHKIIVVATTQETEPQE